MRLLLVLLCLSTQAWGATGSAAVDTWYVRPVADCPTNGDGLAYACAASAGATGAFSKLVNLIWTATTGIDDGDTLYLCGHFKAADKRNATTMLDVVATAANEAARITINGDCSAAGGPAVATVDSESATSTNVLVTSGTPDPNYITVKNVTLKGATGAGGNCINLGAGTGIQFEDSTLHCEQTGITVTGTSFLIDGITMPEATVLLDAISVGLAAVSGTITNSTLRSHATGNSSDVVDVLGDNITSMTISNNTFIKGTGDKSALTIKAGSGTITVTGNDFNGQTDESYGIRIEDAFAGTLVVERNYLHDFGPTLGNLIQLDAAAVAATAKITSNILQDGASQIVVNDNWTVTIRHNTFHNAGIYGLYSAGTSPLGPDSLTLQNNAFLSVNRHINSLGFEDATVIDYNAYYGGGDFRLNGTVYATLAAAVAATTYEDNGLSSNPLFAGGAAPVNAQGLRLSANSPLRAEGAELNIGNVQDQGNRAFGHPPSIGAWEAASGDAVARTAASARATAAARTAASARSAR